MPEQPRRSGRYMPGLDGLRAISVIAVIAYHLGFGWATGGLLGVGVFFVLSGYLITDQLVDEWRSNRSIDLKRFWARRARRLLPAMFAMLVLVAFWLLLVDPDRLVSLRGDFMSVLLYFNNWWLIFHQVSYFESFGPPSPIGHLWSLAVEEQFYIVWPFLLLVGLRLAPRRGKLILFTLIVAAASAAAMALLYVPGTDPSRVYYGTDTRVFAPLIGAALAIAWPSRSLKSQANPRFGRLLDVLATLSLVGIFLMIARTAEYGDFLYYGGFVLLSVLSAILIAALANPDSRLARLLGTQPLRWIGVRSYSLYIWHFPVIALTNPAVNTNGFDATRALMQVTATVLLAALSWRFVEQPIRHGALGRTWKRLRLRPQLRIRPIALVTFVLIVLLYVSANSRLNEPVSADSTLDSTPQTDLNSHEVVDQPGKIGDIPIASDNEPQQPVKDSDPEPNSSSSPSPKPSPKPSPTPSPKPKPDSGQVTSPPSGGIITKDEEKPSKPHQPDLIPGEEGIGKGITVIGDSVILDAEPYLHKLLPGIVVDGKIGRQMTKAQETIDLLKENGELGDRIVIELGTNGSFNSKQLRKLLDSLSGAKQVLLVNTRVPTNWQDTVNSALDKVSADYPNATVVDWYSASKGKDSFFEKDGTHLKREGAQFYAKMLVDALKSY